MTLTLLTMINAKAQMIIEEGVSMLFVLSEHAMSCFNDIMLLVSSTPNDSVSEKKHGLSYAFVNR